MTLKQEITKIIDEYECPDCCYPEPDERTQWPALIDKMLDVICVHLQQSIESYIRHDK